MPDPLDTVLRLRRVSVDDAKRGLAAAIRAEGDAQAVADAAEALIGAEAAAAADVAAPDAAVAAFAAWLPTAAPGRRPPERGMTGCAPRSRWHGPDCRPRWRRQRRPSPCSNAGGPNAPPGKARASRPPWTRWRPAGARIPASRYGTGKSVTSQRFTRRFSLL